jgi:tripartite-type tricarboxylate transporter receptor subunit TctC
MRALALALFLISTAAAFAQPAFSQLYPSKTIRIVVPSPAGGPSDVGARVVGEKIAASWGQPVVIDNRPGGNNIIGTQVVAKAPPDGYTILIALDSTLTMHPSLYSSLPYNPAKDFAPVALAFISPIVLITDAAGPNSVRELIQFAKANPGKVSFGAGTLTTRLAGELLKSQTGTDMLIVPYKGSAGTTQGLLSKDVTFTLDGVTTSMPHIRAGKLKALANLTKRPIAALPNLPTFADETGIRDFDVSVWLGFVVPAGTPPDIVTKLNQEIVRVLGLPDVKEKLSSIGLEPGGGTPAEFGSFIRTETDKWTRVIKASGFKAE